MAKKSSSAGRTIKKKTSVSTVRKTTGTKKIAARANLKPVSDKNDVKVMKALYEIADAASAVKDMQSFYKKLHTIVGKLMYAENFFIATYDEQSGLLSFPYFVDEKDEPPSPQPLTNFRGGTGYVIKNGKIVNKQTGLALMARGETSLVGTLPEDWIFVPLKHGSKTLGALAVQIYQKGIPLYTPVDEDLLSFVAQHIATALTRARAIEAEHQRIAELAIINSVQRGLASKLEMKAIYELIGETMREIFVGREILLFTYDALTEFTHFTYVYENGERLYAKPEPINGFTKQLRETGQALIINERFLERAKAVGSEQAPAGLMPKSIAVVPFFISKKFSGIIGLEDTEKENSFSDSDIRLLETLANSMSVALENARLFDETQRLFKAEQARVAELQIINSIQQGLAAELDFQAIVDLVGEKLREVFETPDLGITWYDDKTNLIHYLYHYEHGKRLSLSPMQPQPGGIFETQRKNRQPVVFKSISDYEKHNAPLLPGTDQGKSYASVPIIGSDRVLGSIGVENYERENAYGESELRLLTTIAASLGTALENARLFDETQRLLKITEDRAQELAIINSIQQGLASKLDLQAIIDLVGQKLRDILNTEDLGIRLYDEQADLIHYLYEFEHGERLTIAPVKPTAMFRKVQRDQQPIFGGTREIGERFGLQTVPGTEQSKALAIVPIIAGNKVIGAVAVENFEREDFFHESNIRLMQTIAASMGVALENARLFDETQRLFQAEQQRAAELAIINSVQDGLASKLEMRAIYDLVGDKIREIFDAQVVAIVTHDQENNLAKFEYVIEKGERLYIDPMPSSGISGYIFKTGQPVMINENLSQKEAELLGRPTRAIAGADIKARLDVPMIVDKQVKGVISLQNVDRENAFSESDLRLLTTLANSMSVALENARLFDETQRLLKETDQRAAELAIINSVQQGLASKLDMQAIYDLVGDKIRDLFDAQAVLIITYDRAANLFHYPYNIEKGKHFDVQSTPPIGLSATMLTSRQSLMINRDFPDRYEELTGRKIIEFSGDTPRSWLGVPLVIDNEVRGVITLQNVDREDAFTESDLRLLQTLAGSMGIALENARLFNAEQQRVAELAIINSVQAALAAKVDMQGIYEVVGDKIREIFDAQSVLILTYDHSTHLRKPQYIWEKGERFYNSESLPFNKLAERLNTTKSTIVIDKFTQEIGTELGMVVTPGTESMKSGIFVPLIAGNIVTGLISLQNIDRENAFSDSDVRLLQTLANSMSVALENARLFNAEQQRVAELAIINSVQEGLAKQLDFQGIVDLVGAKVGEIFAADTTGVFMYDAERDWQLNTYYVDGGERTAFPDGPALRPSLGAIMVDTRKPLLLGTGEESGKLGAWRVASAGAKEDKNESYLGVPIMAGDKVIGAMNVQSYRQRAYNQDHLRLMQTIANSMSIALENARLFDETQRLLKETEERNAELAIINSVQDGLAAKLDMQAIYDLVGNKICEIFSLQTCFIMIYDREHETEYYPFLVEDGTHQTQEPIPHDDNGFGPMVMRTRQPIMINEKMIERSAEVGSYIIGGGSEPKSAIYVPLLIGNQARGVISVQNMQREHAFTESDQRLLNTLASSMSVALESARLFAETEQRAAELATVNTVSKELAGELDIDPLIQMVGEQVRTVFKADIAYVALLDESNDMINFPYTHGEDVQPRKLGEGLTSRIIQNGKPLLINEELDRIALQLGTHVVGKTAQSYLGVPIFVGGKSVGVISVQSTDRTGVFKENDQRLLTTIAANVGTALHNARLFDEVTQRKEYFEVLFRNNPVAVVTIDNDAVVTSWNPAAEKLFGYTQEDAIGRNVDDLVASNPELHGEAVGFSKAGLDLDSYAFQVIARRTRKDGSLVDVELSGVPIVIQNQKLGMYALYHDITELERARRDAIAANEAKSSFLATMSYELRTPLNAIIGFTRIVRRKAEGTLPDKQTENLDKVLSSAEHLLGLINTVLDIAKIEAGRMDVQAANFNMSALADQCAALAAPLLKPAVTLEKRVDEKLDLIYSDQDKIKQIVLNLLSNAAKFTHDGRIVLNVERSDSVVRVRVIDSGIGISEEALGRIFEEFQQADTSTTRQYGGTGLGLAISRNLAKLLGGDLTASSELGTGSTFTLTLPIHYGIKPASSPDTEADSDRLGETQPKIESTKNRVLVIDDDPDAVYLLQESLGQNEFEVIGARNGHVGLQKARDEQPQAILLDILMPETDGWQVLHDLKQDTATADIPVILLTIVDKKALGFRLGAAAYLLKPLDPTAVIEVLHRVIGETARPHKHVLVVDDDPHIADMLHQILPESDFNLDSAEDGEAGLKAVDALRPDVILLDLMMPKLDGFGVIEKLRADPELRTIPIIVISAKELTDDETKILRESVAFVMKKQGFDGDKLVQEIKDVLNVPR